MKMPPLQNRAAILLFFLFLWAALVAAHLFFYTVIARDEYIKRGNAIAMRSGKIPAGRGNLLDKTGKRIAWTEIYIDLCVEGIPKDSRYRSKIDKAVKLYFPEFTLPDGKEKKYITKNISPQSQIQLLQLVKKFPEISFKTRKERKYISQKIKEYLKDTGIDQLTRGKEGFFKVMADRKGNWIPRTWDENIKHYTGNDIKLEVTLDELLRKAESINKKNQETKNGL